VSVQTAPYGRLLAILERGDAMPVVTRRDMRLVADALADQSRRLSSRAIGRASLREQAGHLAELAAELGPHDGLLLVGEASW
jgi:hypothetical protein